MRTRGSKKTETKKRVVEAAARLFREGGVARVGIDEVMRAAELTHGGFYAHWKGKEALAADAVTAAFDEACRNLFGFDGNGQPWLERAGRRYLSRSHVDSPGEGCALPTLAGEAARSGKRVRRAFSRGISRVVDEMSVRMSDGGGAADRRRAIITLSQWAGAILMARAVDDRALSDEILEACRKELTSDARK